MIKRLAFLLVMLVILGPLLACGSSVSQPAVSANVVNEIYAIASDESVAKYISIRIVEDEGSYISVTIDILYNEELIQDLEDAYKLAEMWTKAAAESTVNVLSKYGISKDVFVHAHLPLGNDEVAVLGKTYYDCHAKTYQFERYEP